MHNKGLLGSIVFFVAVIIAAVLAMVYLDTSTQRAAYDPDFDSRGLLGQGECPAIDPDAYREELEGYAAANGFEGSEVAEELALRDMERNSVTVLDVKRGAFFSDERKSPFRLACEFLGLCDRRGALEPDMASSFGLGEHLRRTRLRAEETGELGADAVPLDLASAIKKGGCTELTNREAEAFLCNHGVLDNGTLERVMANGYYCSPLPPSSCDSFQRCISNIMGSRAFARTDAGFFSRLPCIKPSLLGCSVRASVPRESFFSPGVRFCAPLR